MSSFPFQSLCSVTVVHSFVSNLCVVSIRCPHKTHPSSLVCSSPSWVQLSPGQLHSCSAQFCFVAVGVDLRQEPFDARPQWQHNRPKHAFVNTTSSLLLLASLCNTSMLFDLPLLSPCDRIPPWTRQRPLRRFPRRRHRNRLLQALNGNTAVGVAGGTHTLSYASLF